jgi:nitroimidazol reductase NimA-like FMN-containing flavoprotein (pyridoxamine 5'-phosphate oxidase superfamily)
MVRACPFSRRDRVAYQHLYRLKRKASAVTQIPRTRVRRHPERGDYDEATIHAILDEGFLCHVGFVHDDQPYVIPTLYVRAGDTIYLHGSPVSRMLGTLAEGPALCITVTHLDGLVLARSVFNHSANYRSVVVLGHGREVTDPAEKLESLHLLVEHVLPGRSIEAREPNAKELQTTMVIAVTIEEASAKVRTGPPSDAAADHSLDVWAGVLPFQVRAQEPIPDPQLTPGIAVPPSVLHFHRGPAGD